MSDRVRPAGVDSARAWSVAAAAALSTAVVFGVAYSFGAFFDAMSASFGTSSAATALVFSVTVSASFLLGLVTGRWVDRVGPRRVLLAGSASLVAGLLATAAAPSILVGYVTYGAGVGFAVACGYVPMVSTVGAWFRRRRAAALGVAVSGIGIGTLIGSPLAAASIEATSWRRTYVVFALGGGAALAVAALVAAPGPDAEPPERPRSLRTLFALPGFSRLYLASLLVTFGLFVPFVFLASDARSRGVDEVAAATLVGLIGGASVVGRLGLGALADRWGLLRLFRWSFAVMAFAHLVWLGAGGAYPLLVAYTVVLGVGYGGFIALSPAVVADLFGLEGLGGTLGSLYTSAAAGSLLGPPVAGLLRDGLGMSAAVAFAVTASAAAALVVRPLGRSPTAGGGAVAAR
ncbi:MAG: MFS transporter [Actinomyces sp.]|nr:MAG: MFS transporter [Actinomyces sp.]